MLKDYVDVLRSLEHFVQFDYVSQVDSIVLNARQFRLLNTLDGLRSIGKFLLVDFFNAAHSSRLTVPSSVNLVVILASARIHTLYKFVVLIEALLSSLRYLAERVVVLVFGIPGRSVLHCLGCKLDDTFYKVFDFLFLRMHATFFKLASQIGAISAQPLLLLRGLLTVSHLIDNLNLIDPHNKTKIHNILYKHTKKR